MLGIKDQQIRTQCFIDVVTHTQQIAFAFVAYQTRSAQFIRTVCGQTCAGNSGSSRVTKA